MLLTGRTRKSCAADRFSILRGIFGYRTACGPPRTRGIAIWASAAQGIEFPPCASAGLTPSVLPLVTMERTRRSISVRMERTRRSISILRRLLLGVIDDQN